VTAPPGTQYYSYSDGVPRLRRATRGPGECEVDGCVEPRRAYTRKDRCCGTYYHPLCASHWRQYRHDGAVTIVPDPGMTPDELRLAGYRP